MKNKHTKKKSLMFCCRHYCHDDSLSCSNCHCPLPKVATPLWASHTEEIRTHLHSPLWLFVSSLSCLFQI